jgi:hypothetical protein
VNKGYLRFNPSFDQTKIQVVQSLILSASGAASNGFKLVFKGNRDSVNQALDLFEYKPLCPFDVDNTLNVRITASPAEGSST